VINNIFKPVDVLQKGLSAAWTRNAVIRHNIANIETPNFKASDVEFETLLARALLSDEGFGGITTHPMHIDNKGFHGARTHQMHLNIGTGSRIGDISSIEAQVVLRRNTSMRMDGTSISRRKT
jgi:flagellar basal-body rod protein FlgB